MRTYLRAPLVFSCLVLLPVAACLAQDSAELESLAQRSGYAIGLDLGRRLASQAVDTDVDAISSGIRDGLAGSDPRLSDEQLQQAMQELNEKLQARAAQAGSINQSEGAAFLAENGKREGVETTASGLQYEVISSGDGAKPKATDTVRVHYEGRLLDDKVFDSSYKRGEPATFPVNRVIAGWTEALQLMPVGSKWKLFIPSDLAYGAQGAGADIGANATLVFDVELLGIEN
jgi:FKBP-type peptidyl-prolyl cis-trans isomerase FklB